MKIAFISLMAGQPWGGSELLWSKAADYALSQNNDVIISLYDWGEIHPEIKKLKNKGAKIFLRQRFNYNSNILSKTILHFKNRINWLNDAYMPIIRLKPDHIVINQGDSFDISIHHYQLYELIKKYKIPFTLICHSHAQFSDIPQVNVYPKAKSIFEEAKNVYFVSKRMQSLTERKLCTKLSNGRFTWNPLNLKVIEYISWPSNPTLQFAIVGNLSNNKGHDTLFECLSSNVWKSRDWHLNIYGNGYGLNYLKDLAKYYKLTDRITFHGHVSDIIKVWQNNHILLIPSAAEGLPISLIEAMICGRPAVVTDVGGNTEIITEEVNGFIAEAPTVSSFSNALKKAWTHKDKWQTMGKNAHEYCIKNVDLQPEIKLLDSIINNHYYPTKFITKSFIYIITNSQYLIFIF